MFPRAPIEAGDFVATIGFSSADYLTIDLVCGYLGLVAVPLQHNTSASRLVPILERENATLKRLRADAELEKACPAQGDRVRHLQRVLGVSERFACRVDRATPHHPTPRTRC